MENEGNASGVYRRRWLILGILLMVLLLCRTAQAQAAVAQITLQKSADEIVKGDIFYIVVTVSADEEMTGFEGYFTYDQNVMKYLTGGSVASANDDTVHIRDKKRESGAKMLKYSIRFRARKAGESTVALQKPCKISAEEDTGWSTGSASLLVRVISRKEQKKKQAVQNTKSPDASAEKESAPSEIPPAETGEATTEHLAVENAGTPETDMPAESPPQSMENASKYGNEAGRQEETSEKPTPSAETAQAEDTSQPADSVQAGQSAAAKKERALLYRVILFLSATGLVMIAILSAGIWKRARNADVLWEQDAEEEETDAAEYALWEMDAADDSKREGESGEYAEVTFERGKTEEAGKDSREETAYDEEMARQDMREVQRRLEEKRRWLRKE